MHRFKGLVLLFLLATVSASLVAQSDRGSISGTVVDSTGAAMAAVQVTAVQTTNRQEYRSATNETGAFLFANLPPGNYDLTVAHPGFKRLERTGLQLLVGNRMEVSLSLEVGDTAESITVTAEAPILETGSADLGKVVDQTFFDRQPVATRNVMNMVSYAPGVVGGVGSYGTAAQKDFSVNGSRGGSNEVTVDGMSVVLARGGGTLGNVPLTEAVQEMKVNSTMFDAALGRSSGAAISIVTRGGTNELHGTTYYYWRPHTLRANTWTNNRNGAELAKTGFKLWGGSIGGPVYLPKLYDGRNRTFWFVSSQGDDDIRSQTWQARVPTMLERQGNFSQTLNGQGRALAIYDPFSTKVTGSTASRELFPNATIPANRLTAFGQAAMKLFPEPNVAGADARIGGYNWTAPGNVDVFNRNTGVRLDHTISSNNRLMGRYGYMSRVAGPRNTPLGMSAAPPTGGTALDRSDRKFYSVNLNDDHTFSATTVANFRIAYLRNVTSGSTGDAGTVDPSQLNLPSAILSNQAVAGWPTLSLGENMMTFGGTKSQQANDTWTFNSGVTHLRGKHTFAAGTDWRMGRFNNNSPGAGATGTFTFNNTFTRSDPFTAATGQTTGTSMASLLLGLPASGSFGYSSPVSLTNHYLAFYFKDDWKVSQKLTLNFGLRWEAETPWKERYNRISYDFDSTAASPIQVPGLNLRGGLRFAGENGLSRSQGKLDANNFGPRFGFAYQLLPTLLIRGGYGIFFSTGALESDYYGAVNSFNAVTPFSASNDGGATPFATMANPFPNGLAVPVGTSRGLATEYGNGISYFDQTRPMPYTQQWQFSVQKQMPWQSRIEAAYVGAHYLSQWESFDLNEIPDSYRSLGTADNTQVNNPFFGVLPATTSLGASNRVVQRALWRAYPQYSSLMLNGAPTGRTIYHGLQLSFDKRYSNGVSFMFNYTFSKTIDNNTTSLVNDRSWYRTVAARDRKHLIRLVSNWDLPFGRGRMIGSGAGPVLNRVISGWTVSSRMNIESGVPLSISHPNGRPIRLRNAALSGSVGDRLGDKRDPATGALLNPYFDVNAFQPLASQYDIAPDPPVLDELRGPGSFSLDAVLAKEVRIRERLRAGIRFEAYAVTNTPIFSNPGTSMSNLATFGVINSVGGSFAGRIVGVEGARVCQISLEVKF